MALRWNGTLNVASGRAGGGNGDGDGGRFRVLASLVCNSSGSFLVPAANAIFFVGDRVSGTGNPVVERLSQLDNIAAAVQPKLGQAVNLWIMEPSHYMGPFACYENMLPNLTASGEPMGYSSEGLPAAHRCLATMQDCFAQVREGRLSRTEKTAGQGRRQEEPNSCCEDHLDKASPFEPFLDPSQRIPPTILLGFSKGGVVLNQLLAEIVHAENPGSRKDSIRETSQNYEDGPPESANFGEEKRSSSARLQLLPSSAQAFLRSVDVVHYVDVGLNCQGAYLTDPNVLEGLAKLAASRDRGRFHVGFHGTPRQWEDRYRRWIVEEKDRCVGILRKASEMFGAGKLSVQEELYFPSKKPDLQMHYEIIDALVLETGRHVLRSHEAV